MEPVLDEELGASPAVYLALFCYAEAMGLGRHGPSDLGAAGLGFLLATGSVALGAIVGFVAVVWWIRKHDNGLRTRRIWMGMTLDLAGYTNLSQPSSAGCEMPLVEFQVAHVESLARVGSQLGARIVRIFTAYEVDGQYLPAQWHRCVAAIRAMCDRAAAFGVTIAIQNHHDLALPTEALLELLTDVSRSNCKLGFDAWSPALRGESLYDAARMAASCGHHDECGRCQGPAASLSTGSGKL